EAPGGDPTGHVAVGEGEAPGHAPSTDVGAMGHEAAGQTDQAPLELVAALLDDLLEAGVGPEVEGPGGRHEAGVEPAERAVVLTRLPLVEGRAEERERHGHAVAAERLGEAHDVG